MATIVTIVVTSLLLIFLNLFGNMVEGFYNTLMGGQFQTFDALITFIPNLINGTNSGADVDIIKIFKLVAIAIVMIVLLISTLKSLIAPISGKESENPINIVVRAVVATAAIVLYDKLIFGDYEYSLINILNSIISDSTLFKTSIPSGTLASAWNIGSAVLSTNVLLNMIFYIAILIGLISAGIIHMERYLSFAVFIILGPVCIAFYPSNEHKNITQEWFKGILAQVMGILVSLFALSLVGYSLEAMKYQTDLFHLAVTLTLLQFVKNSEKFINMLGFRTMANMDTFRNVMTGMAGLAAIPKLGSMAGRGVANIGKGVASGKEIADKFAGKENYFSKDKLDAQNNMFGANASQRGFSKGSDGNINKELGVRIADAQSSQTEISKSVKPMNDKEFGKVFDEATIAKGSEISKFSKAHKDARKEAFEAYNKRIESSNEGRESLKRGDKDIIGEQANAAFGTRGKQSEIVGDLHRQTIAGNVKNGYQYVGETLTSKGKDLTNGEKNQELFFVSNPDGQLVNAAKAQLRKENPDLFEENKSNSAYSAIENSAMKDDLTQTVNTDNVSGKFDSNVQAQNIEQTTSGADIALDKSPNDDLEQVVNFDNPNSFMPNSGDAQVQTTDSVHPQMSDANAYINVQEHGAPVMNESAKVQTSDNMNTGLESSAVGMKYQSNGENVPVMNDANVPHTVENVSANHNVSGQESTIANMSEGTMHSYGAKSLDVQNGHVDNGVAHSISSETPMHSYNTKPLDVQNEHVDGNVVHSVPTGNNHSINVADSSSPSLNVQSVDVGGPQTQARQESVVVTNSEPIAHVNEQPGHVNSVVANNESMARASSDSFINTGNVVHNSQNSEQAPSYRSEQVAYQESKNYSQPQEEVVTNSQTSAPSYVAQPSQPQPTREELIETLAYEKAASYKDEFTKGFTFAGKEVSIAAPTFEVSEMKNEGYDKGNSYVQVELDHGVSDYGNGVSSVKFKHNSNNEKSIDEIRRGHNEYQKDIDPELFKEK